MDDAKAVEIENDEHALRVSQLRRIFCELYVFFWLVYWLSADIFLFYNCPVLVQELAKKKKNILKINCYCDYVRPEIAILCVL